MAQAQRTARETLIDTLQFTYGPGFVAIAFAYLVATQDQVQEILIAVAADATFARGDGSFRFWSDVPGQDRAGFVVVLRSALLGFVPFAVWSSAAMTIALMDRPRDWATLWVPIVYGLIAFGGIALGIIRAFFSPEAEGTFWGSYLAIMLLGPTTFPVPVMLHFALLHRLSTGRYRLRRLIVIGAAALLGIGFMVVLPGVLNVLGPIGVSSIFIVILAYGLAALTVLSQFTPGNFPLLLALLGIGAAYAGPGTAFMLAGFCVITVLILLHAGLRPRISDAMQIGGLAAIFALIGGLPWLTTTCATLPGCNIIQGVPPVAQNPRSPLTARLSWENEGVPTMRLVAAQGGGLYAAYHTAYYLATRADTEPNFAKSVFAISGVSGGSVGAGIYWAIRQSGLCNAGPLGGTCHREAVRQILKRDYLSAPLAGFFFRDNLDNYIPISALWAEPIDRGRVLENAFHDAVEDWMDTSGQPGDSPLHAALTGSWAPKAGAPLLLFNATDVSQGARVVLSPLDLLNVGEKGRLELANGMDLTVANGMVMSARFPVISPPGRVTIRNAEGEVETHQLVDGGYFDNSGIETLLEFLAPLSAQRGSKTIEIIVFSAEEPAAPRTIKGTAGAPISAFTGAWRSRRELTARRLGTNFGEQTGGDPTVRVCDARTHPEGVNFTVSWFLAENTFDKIEFQVERELGLQLPEGDGATADWLKRRSNNLRPCRPVGQVKAPG